MDEKRDGRRDASPPESAAVVSMSSPAPFIRHVLYQKGIYSGGWSESDVPSLSLSYFDVSVLSDVPRLTLFFSEHPELLPFIQPPLLLCFPIFYVHITY